MKPEFIANLKSNIAKKACVAMMALSPAFAGNANAQNNDRPTPQNNSMVSVNFGISNMSSSFKNQANSILTWRDLIMLDIGIDYNLTGDWGTYVKFSKSLDHGYSTDDDIDNNIVGLSAHRATAMQFAFGQYVHISPNSTVGLNESITYFNNYQGLASLVNGNDINLLETLVAQSKDPDITSHLAGQAQQYYVFRINPFYTYERSIVSGNKHSLDAAFTGMPILYISHGDWDPNKQLTGLTIELGGKVAFRWNVKNHFYVEVFDEASASCAGILITKRHDKKSCQLLRNTHSNVLGAAIGFRFGSHSK